MVGSSDLLAVKTFFDFLAPFGINKMLCVFIHIKHTIYVTIVNNLKIAYKLIHRFESLINSINQIDSKASKFKKVRLKPWFINYNSCIEEFEIHFQNEYKRLNLEPLPLRDTDGNDAFTLEKLITLLPQAEAVVALLKGLLPPNYTNKAETLKDSLSWYWNNTHWSAMLFFVGLLFSCFIAGIILSETNLYKKTIKPFIIEYKMISGITHPNTTNMASPKQERTTK